LRGLAGGWSFQRSKFLLRREADLGIIATFNFFYDREGS